MASSIHEAFILCDKEEDNSKLREAYKVLLEENDKEILTALTSNLDIVLNSYCNEHCTKTFNFANKSEGSTPIAQNGLMLPKA